YSAAWSVIGGISLPNDSQPIELCCSKNSRFVLTCDPDSLLANIDRGAALRRLMIKGMAGQRWKAELPIALEAEIEEIKAERKEKTGTQAVLVFEAHGEIDATINTLILEHEGFVVALNAIDKKAVRQTHQSEIEAMKLAVAFESEVPSRFAALSEGTYLTDEAGRIVYSINFSASCEASVSTNLSAEGQVRISARYAMLQQANDVDSVQRLFSQMADYGTDRLKAFLSGWAALEILIAKSFKTYEQVFLSPLTNAGQPTLRERFLGRIKDVMKDKYKLTDKFIAVAAVLFPTVPDAEVEEDRKKFFRLKELRDSILHGDEFSEKDLPVHDLAVLLRKYVLAHIEAPNQTLNTNGLTSAQREIVAELEADRKLVEANRELIVRLEAKTKAKLAEGWREEPTNVG
ncbi:MAG: hypothetical protein WCK89_18050, partial [bacterium]